MSSSLSNSPINEIIFQDSQMPMLDSDDFLLDDLTLEFLETDDDIFGECSQAFIEASQSFHKLPLYYHVGSGFDNQPGPSTSGPAFVENIGQNIDLRDSIVVQERFRRMNRKYKAEEVSFRVHVDPERLPDDLLKNPIVLTVQVVKQIFQVLRERCIENLRPSDLIRMCILADGLDKPISTTLLPVLAFTVEKILSSVSKVLQSKDEIRIDGGFTADLITISRDIGAGPNCKVLNVDIDRIRKTSIRAIPMDNDGLCCAKAIVFALAHEENDLRAINALRNPERPALRKRAQELHFRAGVPLGPCTYGEIARFEQHLNVQIVVISTENLHKVSYKGQSRSRRINLWLHNNHYDVIKSLKGFYGRHFYCEACEKPYDHKERHRCDFRCNVCRRLNCFPDGHPVRCDDCDRNCDSKECFEAHKAISGNQELSLCDRIYQCRLCRSVIYRQDCPKHKHQCGTVRCPSCKKFVVASEHECFLKKVQAKDPSEKLIFFDFETDQQSGEHVVNFAIAQYMNGEEKIFEGYNACENFCAWLFTQRHKGYTAIAHNMKGFDGQFVLRWILEQGTAPEIIPCGSKIMSITHKSLGIKLIDSFNFLPMALARLPACFGLTELKKGFFPHLFNTRENQDYVGSIPDIKYYNPDTMSSSTRAAFLEWYKEHEADTFDFQEEMLSYCRSDVDILRRCCVEFRSQFIEVSGVDPFCFVTIASACMAVYRSAHIIENTIAMVPVRGYINSTNYSIDSIRWLDFISETEGIAIKHALNGHGEKRLGGISVDGFCEQTKTVYQYHGCFFHGCPICFDVDSINPVSRVTMASLHMKTEENTAKLRTLGFHVVEKWEHEFLREKKEGNLMAFLQNHSLSDRLNPRDAFFGGRTNAVKLFHQGPAKYVDFTSLYPWVNKYCKYPVGHPLIITKDFGDLNQYFGIIKCEVLPPRGLFLPVLPYKSNGKLMFPLCRVCCDNLQQADCQHSDQDRIITGTWVTEELKMAVQKGYRVIHICEVYHFPTSSSSLFKSYIDLFLKIKQESSGWPTECVTEEEKLEYIKQYERREGVLLDPVNITKNPGRRQVAKLALNSFWGRWGMNLNKPRISYVNSLPSFNKTLFDTTKKIKDVYLSTPEVAAIHWEDKEEFVQQDTATNVFLAAFTTAWARLKLYSEMDKLGTAVLYHDTDSIVYATDGKNDPPLGNFLGDFTDELDGDTIETFVSGGPKNYAFSTEKGKTSCKIRGFTLNFKNSQILNFESLKSMITTFDLNSTIPIHTEKITRDGKKRKICNKPETKLYRMVYDKRVVKEDFSTLPYGF